MLSGIVHVDIAFGDCVAQGGFWYAFIFVDRATRYNWVFGLKDLSSNAILSAFRLFHGDVGLFPRCFRSDCDTKLIGARIHKFMLENDSNIDAATAGRQSARPRSVPF